MRLLGALVWLVAACGGGSRTGPLDGGPDRCTGDGDCPGGTCWRFPEGQAACATPAPIATEPCDAAPPTWLPCECERDGDCAARPGGRCVPHALGWCGGAAPPPGNGCRYDGCAGDGDCTAQANGRCVPAGAFGLVNRTCVYGACRFSAECTSGSAGQCRYHGGRCGGGAVFFCAYEGDPCRTDSECPPASDGRRQICVPRVDNQGTRCLPEPPPAP